MLPHNSFISITEQSQYKEHKQYKYLIFIAMLSMTIMLCKGILSYRLVELGGFIMQAGQLVAPFWFMICDVTAEIYGYQIAKKIILAGLSCQIIFSLMCSGLTQLPYPEFWHENPAYTMVLGDMWRVSFAVLIALVISGFVNIKLISKWKILTKGKYFWLRCIGASIISEFLFSILATLIIQYGKQDMTIIFLIISMSLTLKLIYSIILVFPAIIAVFYLKRAENL